MKKKPLRMRKKPLRMKKKPLRMKKKPLRMKKKPLRMKKKPLRMKKKPLRMKKKPLRTRKKPLRFMFIVLNYQMGCSTMLRKVYTKFHYVFAMIVVVLMENIMCRWVLGEICIFVFKQFAGTDWKVVLLGFCNDFFMYLINR